MCSAGYLNYLTLLGKNQPWAVFVSRIGRKSVAKKRRKSFTRASAQVIVLIGLLGPKTWNAEICNIAGAETLWFHNWKKSALARPPARTSPAAIFMREGW
jgi:hypothetical protein